MARQINNIRAKSKACQNNDMKDVSTGRDEHDTSKINGNKLQRRDMFLEKCYTHK
jgi:Fic family protein